MFNMLNVFLIELEEVDRTCTEISTFPILVVSLLQLLLQGIAKYTN